MKKFVTLLLCMLPVSLFAQVNDGIRQAMDNYDYETVVSGTERGCATMSIFSSFLLSVLASVVAYYICKWLDGDK